jgi:two-component system, NarL family, capsular synthesis sensor histidine kinase RcsC
MKRPSPRAPLARFQRHQHMLMFGGGVAITVTVLFAMVLECAMAVHAYISNERQDFSLGLRQIAAEVSAFEAASRAGNENIKHAWKDNAAVSPALSRRFYSDGRFLEFRQAQGVLPILVIGLGDSTRKYEDLDRVLQASESVASLRTASLASRGQPSVSYFYDAERSLIALSAFPPLDSARIKTILATRNALTAVLINDMDHSVAAWIAKAEGRTCDAQAVTWLPPYDSPITGERAVREVFPLFAADCRLIGIRVVEFPISRFPVEVMKRAIPPTLFDSTLGIVSSDGQIITETGMGPLHHDLFQRVISSGLAESMRGGFLVLKDKFGSTGWFLIYALPWRGIVAGVWPQLAVSLAAGAIIIVMTWILLLLFNRRVFLPVLARSQRVFESERLNRIVIQTAPIGLGLISGESKHLLLRSPIWDEMASRVVVDEPTLAAELVQRYTQHLGTANQKEAAGTVMQEDIRLPMRDREPVSLAVSFAPGRYQGEDVLVTAFIDVTTKAQLEQQLRDAKQAADQANAAKSMFLATMSHEIRTPLNAILGNLELFAHSRLDVTQRARLATVRNASDGLLEMIRDVLDFSKIEAGEIALEHIGFDAAEVISPALMAFAPVAHAKKVALYAEFGTWYRVPMIGDPTRLRQIVNNLLSNAIKFTAQGSVSVRVAVDATRMSRELRVEVEDTGIGMTAAQQATAFQAFAQADASINRRYGGTGLGLALCGRLAQAMGAAIEVRSEPGNGSCFSFSLPLDIAEAATAVGQPRFAGESVVLLASDATWLRCMSPILEGWGLRIAGYLGSAHITEPELEAAGTLMLCGDRDQWSADEENELIGQVSRVIDCCLDGPLHPVRTGRIVSVSCYAPAGLLAAFEHVLHGVPLASASQQTTQAPLASQMTQRMRVLVAEDNEVNQRLFADQLAMLHCDGRIAASGLEALQLLSGQTFDVLLTDLNMPGMNGYELAETVQRRWPDLPVIAVTAGATQSELARCEEVGMWATATKPLLLRELQELLTRVTGVARSSEDTHWRPMMPEGVDPHSSGGGIEVSDELWATFTSSCGRTLEALRAASSAGDLQGIKQEVHSLKGALGVFGYRDLAKKCGTIEWMADGEDHAAVEEELGALLRELSWLECRDEPNPRA